MHEPASPDKPRLHAWISPWVNAVAWPLIAFAVWICLRELWQTFVIEAGGAFNVDSSLFWTIGRGIVNGLTPYTDLFEVKPPGIFVLSALSYALSGSMSIGFVLHALAIVLPPFLLAGAAAWMTRNAGMRERIGYALLAFTVGTSLALYTEHKSLGFITESFGAFFIICYALVIASKERMTWTRIGLAAAALFCGIGFKEPFALAGLAVALLLSRSPSDLIRSFLIPIAIAAVAGAAVMAVTGMLGDYLAVYLPHIFGHHIQHDGPLLLRGLHWNQFYRHINIMWNELPRMTWVILLLIASGLFAGADSVRPRNGWTMGAGILLLCAGRFPDVPALFILALAAGLIAETFVLPRVQQSDSPRFPIIRLLRILSVAAYIAALYLLFGESVTLPEGIRQIAFGILLGASVIVPIAGFFFDRRGTVSLIAFFILAGVLCWITYIRTGESSISYMHIAFLIAAACIASLAGYAAAGRRGLWLWFAVIASLYLMMLGVGVGGVYANYHFILCVPVYAALLLRLTGWTNGKAPWLRHAIALLLFVSALAAVSHNNRSEFLTYQEEQRQRAEHQIATAAEVDRVLDACGIDRYLYIGENWPGIFAYTRHSPFGPFFYQSPLLLSDEENAPASVDLFRQTMARNLREARLVVYVNWTLPYMGGDVREYLEREFVTEPWPCAGNVQTVDNDAYDVHFRLYYRKP